MTNLPSIFPNNGILSTQVPSNQSINDISKPPSIGSNNQFSSTSTSFGIKKDTTQLSLEPPNSFVPKSSNDNLPHDFLNQSNLTNDQNHNYSAPKPIYSYPSFATSFTKPSMDLLPLPKSPCVFGFSKNLNPTSIFQSGSLKYTTAVGSFSDLDLDMGMPFIPDFGRIIQLPPHGFLDSHDTITYNQNTHGSLQRCIDSLRPHSTLIIPAGIYEENIRITKNLVMKGNGKVKIVGNGLSDTVSFSCKEVIIQNIKFVAKVEQKGGAASFINTVASLTNCKFSKSGVSVCRSEGNSYLSFKNCILKGGALSGLFVSETTKVSLVSCQIINNNRMGIAATGFSVIVGSETTIQGHQESGVYLAENSSINLFGSNISNNGKKGIDIVSRSQDILIDSSIIEYHSYGIFLCNQTRATLHKNQIRNNQVHNIYTKSFCRIIMYYNVIQESQQNPLMILEDHTKCYSYSDSFSGTCKVGIAVIKESSFIAKKSKFSGLTGQGIYNIESSITDLHSCTFSGIQQTAINSRTNSSMQIRDCTYSNCASPVIMIKDRVKGFIRRCKFIRCNLHALDIGNGISDFVIKDSDFCNSGDSAVKVRGLSSPTFVGCRFFSNNVSGVDIFEPDSCPEFQNCEFYQNKDCGASVMKNSRPIFTGCSFSNNRIGIEALSSNAIISNSTMSKNLACGALISERSSITFISSKFFGNPLNVQILHPGTIAELKNCSIKDSITHSGVLVTNSSTLNASNCEFENNFAHHVDVSKGSECTLTECISTKSLSGVGFHAHERSKLLMNQCKVSSEKNIGVFISGSEFELNGSVVRQNEATGILIQDNSSFKIYDSDISANKTNGIEVNGASGSVKKCTIIGNTNVGILIQKNYDEVQTFDLRFATNGKDLVRST